MSIFKLTPESEFYSYRFQYQGKRYRGVCYGCTTVTEARNFELKIKGGLMSIAEKTTLRELFESHRDLLISDRPIYLDKAFDMAMAKPHRRKACQERQNSKRLHWNDFVFFMHRMYPDCPVLQKVTRSHAEHYIGFIREHGAFEPMFKRQRQGLYANNTLNTIHISIAEVFDLLQSDSGMPENPFKHIPKLPATSESHEPYTFDELQKIFSCASQFLHPLFMIGLFSGLRMGDICTLRKSDVMFDRHFIIRRQNKTTGVASIPMHEYLENYMRELFEKYPDSPFVLPEHAEQYSRNRSTISNMVRRFLEKDLRMTCNKHIDGRKQAVNLKGIHSLRHTFCTIAGVVGIPETVVRSIVGHMTPEMTRLYTRHVEESEKLKYIQLFGQKIGELPEIPIPLPPPDTSEHDKKIAAVAAAGKERDKLTDIIQRMPICEVRELLVTLMEKYPNPYTASHSVSF